MLEIISQNSENITLAFNVITGIVTIASIVCNGTNTPPENTKLGKVYKIIEYLAFNFGKAKQIPPKK